MRTESAKRLSCPHAMKTYQAVERQLHHSWRRQFGDVWWASRPGHISIKSHSIHWTGDGRPQSWFGWSKEKSHPCQKLKPGHPLCSPSYTTPSIDSVHRHLTNTWRPFLFCTLISIAQPTVRFEVLTTVTVNKEIIIFSDTSVVWLIHTKVLVLVISLPPLSVPFFHAQITPLPWKWRQHIHPEHWYLSTRLHSATTQNSIFSVHTVSFTQDFTRFLSKFTTKSRYPSSIICTILKLLLI